MALAREVFELDDSVVEDDLRWAAQVSVGLDRLVDDFALDSLAYYHRGLDGEMHERLGAGMILGASLLTARGVPAAGEYELRTSLAMLIWTGSARRLLHRVPGAELPRRRRRDGPRRAGAPGHQSGAGRCCAASASITASAAGACPSSSTCGTAR